MEDVQAMAQKAMADAEAATKKAKFYCIRGNSDVAPFDTMQAKVVVSIDALFAANDPQRLVKELADAATAQLFSLWTEYQSKFICVSEEGQ